MAMDILKRFGRRVRELRIKKGITSQMSLALKAGLDRTYIGGVERGERNVGLKISKRSQKRSAQVPTSF